MLLHRELFPWHRGGLKVLEDSILTVYYMSSPKFTPSLLHTDTNTLSHPSTSSSESACPLLNHATLQPESTGETITAVKSSARASPIFGKVLVGYLRMSSESHYFSPKWSFSWKTIKMEEIKHFTRLIRLHTSSGLIQHKQENHKKHLYSLFARRLLDTS